MLDVSRCGKKTFSLRVIERVNDGETLKTHAVHGWFCAFLGGEIENFFKTIRER